MSDAAIARTIEHEVRAGDGRIVHVYEAGDPHGKLVLVHHGTPAAGMFAKEWVRDAQARGIRLVTYDRPGYARSDRLRGRSVADAAADAAAITEALGVGRFRTWGASGGGPHALSCAALLPDRVVAAALAGEAVLEEYLRRDAASLLAAGRDGVVESLLSLPPGELTRRSGGRRWSCRTV
ncbi:alpha/beta fold hydrolase [Micromonospora qiuiae]|nr:alpha/beta fold hydrolase [Micromonospora qiuiae]